MVENIAVTFYNYLCGVIGTEDVVRTRRLLCSVSDDLNIMNVENVATVILSGSKGEGLCFSDSDIDSMIVDRTVGVYENILEANRSCPNRKTSLVMDIEETKPGFTMLRLANKSFDDKIIQSCVFYKGYSYLSNHMFKIWHQKTFPSHSKITKIHGPCVSDKDDNFDCAGTFHCHSWISQASPWIHRPRHSWPSPEKLENIVQHGVLFVAIGCKDSPNEELEWRISFSVAEKQLIVTFTHTQLLCYALLKIMLKDMTKKYKQIKDLLCSYFLKTTLFWVSEQIHPSLWIPKNLIILYNMCVKRLIYFVQTETLPHYFISENNLFENRFSLKEREELLRVLLLYFGNGWRKLLQSDILAYSNTRPVEPNTPIVKLKGPNFHSVARLHAFYVARLMLFEKRSIRFCHAMQRSLNGMKNCDSLLEKNIYLFNFSNLNFIFSQLIDIHGSRNNKKQYIKCCRCISHTMMALNHDAVSGWLMLASYFYNMRQYKHSLKIAEYALSKCLITMNGESNSQFPPSANQKNLIRTIIKYICPILMIFIPNSFLFPFDQKVGFNLGYNFPTLVEPLTYGHFLRSVCYLKLGDLQRSLEANDDRNEVENTFH